MNKLYVSLLTTLFCTMHTHSMEIVAMLENFPELQTKVMFYVIENVPNHMYEHTGYRRYTQDLNNIKRFIMNVSFSSKICYAHINNPIVMRKIIKNCARCFYVKNDNYAIAKAISNPAAKNYINLGEKLCSTNNTAQKVKDLVNSGADINFHTPNVGSVLICFLKTANKANKSYLDTLKAMLDLGADVNGPSSPLLLAIKNKSIDEIKLLLRYYPKFKHLNEALDTGNKEIIDLLLKAGADPNEGLTHILCKTHFRNTEEKLTWLQYFLDHGAIPNEHNLYYAYAETITNSLNPGYIYETQTMNVLQLICKHAAYNRGVLKNALEAQKKINRIVTMLEQKKPGK